MAIQEIKKILPRYTVKEMVRGSQRATQAVRWHGEVLSNKFLKYKKSDTLFILGSGPSINKIDDKQWDVIRGKDSIGFNWWMVHSFVPSFYIFQLPSFRRPPQGAMLDLLSDKHIKYQGVPFVIRGSAFSRGNFNFSDKRLKKLKNNPVYYLQEMPIRNKSTVDIKSLFTLAHQYGYMPHGRIVDYVLKYKLSFFLTFVLAFQMGYKQIVLCGIDVSGGEHFWDDKMYANERKRYRLVKAGDDNFNSDRTRSDIIKMAEWMKEWCTISVINDGTSLYPHLSIYD